MLRETTVLVAAVMRTRPQKKKNASHDNRENKLMGVLLFSIYGLLMGLSYNDSI